MTDLNGKVAVVTGAASGIGRGIARALAEEGAAVVVADIDGDGAEALAGELRERGIEAVAVQVDVTDRDAVEALAERAWKELGRVDILASNAGVISPDHQHAIHIDETEARWVLEVNLMGTWYCCSAFGRRFVEQGTPAWILVTGSENSVGIPHTRAAFYTASKHAVLGLTDVMRRELPDHIHTTLLCPGMVGTNITSSAQHRPDRFGGPGEAGGAMPPGAMDPDEVGRKAVAGMKRGDFYVFTHPPVRELVDERHDEIVAAFEAHAPRFDGDEALDTRVVFEKLRQERNHG